jgi:hypothetical protein
MTEIQINLATAFEELKLELEQLQSEDFLKINSKNIVEDLLQKKLARLANKAQELVNALDDNFLI